MTIPLYRPNNVVIFWAPDEAPAVQDYVVLDASLSEEHQGTAMVTKHPVEAGVQISDHYIAQPDKVKIEGFMSNSHLVPGATFYESWTRAEDAYEKLLNVKQRGWLVFIHTPLRQYENMALVSISVPRDMQKGSSVWMNMDFEEVLIAESEVVDAPKPEPKRAQPIKKGTKASTDASLESANKTTILTTILEALGAKN